MLWYVAGALMLAILLRKVQVRLALSRAKHRSITGHSRMARRIAALIPYYEFTGAEFFNADGAPAEVAAQRRAGFKRLSTLYAKRFPRSVAMTEEVQETLSDLQFTARYRVPFQFSRMVREHLQGGTFLQSSSGTTVTDVDGNTFYDLTGSYGVNLFGYDFYKECIAQGSERVRELGPVLGAYHPVMVYNVHAVARDLRTRRDIAAHVRHRGGHAGRAPGALSHAAQVPGALLRRLPRLVGRRSAGSRQPDRGARDLHPQGHGRGVAARPAHAAATSPACW